MLKGYYIRLKIDNTPEIFHNNWIRGESFVFVIFVIDN